MKKFKKIGSNSIDPATTGRHWGKRPHKRYKDCARKGGKTTNSVITDKMFKRELELYLMGGAVIA